MASSPALSQPVPDRSWLHRWIYYLAAGFIFAAVTLRSILVFEEEPFLGQLLALLAVWWLAFLAGSLTSPRQAWLAALLMGVIAALPLIFLYLLKTDFFASLSLLVGMQAMRRYRPWVTGGLLGLAMAATYLLLRDSYGSQEALALALVYGAAGAFIAAYIGSTRRSQRIQEEQQSLLVELDEANRKLEVMAIQQQELVAVHERQRLARELHDSVTQTIFSMTLTTQTALLLQERDPQQVPGKLDRLDQLVHSAMAEMQVLISRLSPEPGAGESFTNLIWQHLEERRRLDGLSVSLDVNGSQPLDPQEEAGLLRIIQEALNNIVKHARVSQASLRVHLSDSPWIEIEDRGAGFDPQQASRLGRMGLTGMRERAAEIGWNLEVSSHPEQGTCIRVSKDPRGGINP